LNFFSKRTSLTQGKDETSAGLQGMLATHNQ